jgi:hypothetical protein
MTLTSDFRRGSLEINLVLDWAADDLWSAFRNEDGARGVQFLLIGILKPVTR